MNNLLSTIPLVLEVDDFGIPVIDFVRDGVKRHDSLHEQDGDSSGKETDQDIVVHDTSTSSVTLEGGDKTLKLKGELPVPFDHALHR